MNSVACPLFQTIATAVVPETGSMTEVEWRQFFDVIDRALARRPAAMRRQLGLFLRILNVLSLLRYRRRLQRLSDAQRSEFLSRIQDSQLMLFRRGFWGIRTLVFMGYYARPETAAALGYRAAARGWELRR